MNKKSVGYFARDDLITWKPILYWCNNLFVLKTVCLHFFNSAVSFLFCVRYSQKDYFIRFIISESVNGL